MGFLTSGVFRACRISWSLFALKSDLVSTYTVVVSRFWARFKAVVRQSWVFPLPAGPESS